MLRLMLLFQLLLSQPAAAQSAQKFLGNGRGINIPSAVLATSGSEPSYQLQVNRFSPALVRQIHMAEFGFVRLIATPVPLMAEKESTRAKARRTLIDQVDAYRSANVGVVLDLHFWSSDAPLHQDNIVTDQRARAALIRAQVEVARELTTRDRVALELSNEPPCQWLNRPFDWAEVQRLMVAQIRASAPKLPLVLTGCRGRRDTLLALDTTPYQTDRNIYWTFHYYEPGVFVSQFADGFRGVPFPPNPFLANSAEARAQMLPPSVTQRRSWLNLQLDTYLQHHRGQGSIRDDMAKVGAWARAQAVKPGHIIIGEFGTLFPATAIVLRPDELRWLRAVREEAARQGFASAWWLLPRPNQLDYDPATQFVRSDTLLAIGGHVGQR